MSRIGNQPITLPAKVEVAISGGEITVKGPLGSLSRRVAEGVTVETMAVPMGWKHELKKNGDRITAITWTMDVKPGEFVEWVVPM